MPTFLPKKSDYVVREVDDGKRKLLLKTAYDQFDTSILGLGDITAPAISIDAIAVVFDLEGFTNFGKQIEPHLTVPLFLSEFLSWLLAEIREEMTHKTYEDAVHLYGPLPFLVKFMGDGLLVLWDVSESDDISRRNIVLSAHQICMHYVSMFLPTICKKVVEPPPKLRCGIARGTVYSVGNRNDFVGSCINMAARLQKIPGLTFAFNRRGFNLEDPKMIEFFKAKIVIKKISVRGIGNHELVAILKTEYEALGEDERVVFKEP